MSRFAGSEEGVGGGEHEGIGGAIVELELMPWRRLVPLALAVLDKGKAKTSTISLRRPLAVIGQSARHPAAPEPAGDFAAAGFVRD